MTTDKTAKKEKKPRNNGMGMVTLRVRIPQLHFDLMTQAVAERNKKKGQQDHINESHLASEIIMLNVQPIANK